MAEEVVIAHRIATWSPVQPVSVKEGFIYHRRQEERKARTERDCLIACRAPSRRRRCVPAARLCRHRSLMTRSPVKLFMSPCQKAAATFCGLTMLLGFRIMASKACKDIMPRESGSCIGGYVMDCASAAQTTFRWIHAYSCPSQQQLIRMVD